ncbi:MAG: hypothetical protein KBS44_07180 [Clostridiales bacterium]|nr:hypothetical protein [Candidatus Coliplasma equi]
MAFKNAEQLNDKLAENVAGGLVITNNFGDYNTYKIGFTKDNYLYTFPSSKYNTLIETATEIAKNNPNASSETLNNLLMNALLEIPGFLTPIA